MIRFLHRFWEFEVNGWRSLRRLVDDEPWTLWMAMTLVALRAVTPHG